MDLAQYLNDCGPRGNFQFRLITEVKGVEFGSPVYGFTEMLTIIRESGIDFGDLRKIIARKAGAGAADWEVY